MRCRFHYGRSTGSKIAEGRARILAVYTVHGRESRAKHAVRSAKLAELHEIEKGMRRLGMTEGAWVTRKPSSS